MINLQGKVVLVTGGTMGIGLTSALEYGAAGAQTVITHRWGTADEGKVKEAFRQRSAPEPWILEADASNDDDTAALMEFLHSRCDGVHALISNVAFAPRIESLDDYNKRALFRSIDYTAWPMWAYTHAIKKKFSRYPRYIVGLSSDGPDAFFANYDFVAMSKAVLETMCRYMNYHLYSEGVRVNVVRSRMVPTASFDATFGEPFRELVTELHFEDCYVQPEEVAKVVFALGSGLLDAIGGQVIMADRGFRFFDGLMGAYARSDYYNQEKKEKQGREGMSQVSNEQIFAVVKKHLTETVDTIDPNSVKREDSMKDLGASSMDIVEVVSCSMRELRVRVPRNELASLKNIGELVSLLERSVEQKQSEAN